MEWGLPKRKLNNIDGIDINDWMAVWLYGCMAIRLYGCMAVWL